MAKKYEHINFTPPKGVAAAAARGLELRHKAKKSNKGGLTQSEAKRSGVGSGVQRAVNLKNQDTLSPATVRRMKAFFARHEKSSKIDPGKTPETDKGYQAFLLWGGGPGKTWANKIVNQMDAIDKKAFPLFKSLANDDGTDYMAMQNLKQIAANIEEAIAILSEDEDYKYPDWLEDKISKMSDDASEVINYIMFNE